MFIFLGGLIQLRSTAFGRFIPSGLAEIAFLLLFVFIICFTSWPRGHIQLRLVVVAFSVNCFDTAAEMAEIGMISLLA